MSIMIPYTVDRYLWGMSGEEVFYDVSAKAFITIVADLIIFYLYYSSFITNNWIKSIEKNEELKRENLIAKYEALKNQVNPHFLFNSLNTLADIVEEDPQLAVRFIEEMASIYRYILDHQSQSLVTLKSEIHAIKSLLFLYEQRHPGAFQLQLNVDKNSEMKLIVPLALQTLIENALKHNHYNAATPLTLKIQAKDDELVIENNVNLRSKTASTFTGLDNLAQRIRFVCQRSLSVHQVAGVFTVAVPLLENESP